MPCLLLGKMCPHLFKEVVICSALSFMYFECYFWGAELTNTNTDVYLGGKQGSWLMEMMCGSHASHLTIFAGQGTPFSMEPTGGSDPGRVL